MLQRCVLLVVVAVAIGVLLRASAEDAPITWPDVRHLRAIVDREKGNAVNLSWPVSQYCAQNDLQNFSVTITKVDDSEFSMTANGTSERVDLVLEQGEAEYFIVVEVKTKFNVHGVAANTSITTGGRPLFGAHLSLPVQEVSPVRAVGDGPFVVVLKHSRTAQCLLIIYDATPSDGYATIEATDLCGDEKRATLAIAVSVKKQALDLLPKMHLLEFDLPDGLLESLPKFTIQTHSAPAKANVELDPPCDVYGRLELTSPKTARLTLTFRPPASHPGLIRNFTFVFSHAKETIVFEVIDDKKLLNHGAKNAIGYGQIERAQHNTFMHFEVHPAALYEYPGNYTVTAFTNGAVSRRAVHSIIMPKFFALQPSHYEIQVSWSSVIVRWDKPILFPTPCTYLVDAIPYDKNASRVTQEPFGNLPLAVFYTLTPATKYSINLGSNCTGSEPFWMHLGEVETEVGVPGVPRDVKLTQTGAKTLNLTWNPPLLLPGRRHYYEWSCESKNNNASIGGETEDTYQLLTNVGSGIVSCAVEAVMKASKGMDKHGPVSPPVEVLVLSADLPQAPPAEIVPVNGTAVSLNLMPVPRPDALGFVVTVDADLAIVLCVDESNGPLLIANNGTLAVRALRTGLASLLLTGLVPHQSHGINITTLFYVNHNTTNSYVVRLVSQGNAATASASTAPLTTVSASTAKVEEEEEEEEEEEKDELATEKHATMGTTEAASITAQQEVPPETTHSTPSTAANIETSIRHNTESSDHDGSKPPPGYKTEGNVNVTTVVLAVLGCMGVFLLVSIAGLILQMWRQKNAAKMFENPPPADLPPLSL